jgi:hypothetical protein
MPHAQSIHSNDQDPTDRRRHCLGTATCLLRYLHLSILSYRPLSLSSVETTLLLRVCIHRAGEQSRPRWQSFNNVVRWTSSITHPIIVTSHSTAPATGP